MGSRGSKEEIKGVALINTQLFHGLRNWESLSSRDFCCEMSLWSWIYNSSSEVQLEEMPATSCRLISKDWSKRFNIWVWSPA
jgi:hypothetical protein